MLRRLRSLAARCTTVVGALLFAVLVMKTPALSSELRDALSTLGQQTVVNGSFTQIFFSGIIGG